MSPDEFTDSAPGRLVRTEFLSQSLEEGGKRRTIREDGWAFVPNPLPPPLPLGELLATIYNQMIAAERLLARLDGIASDLPNARLAWAPLSRREAILSSRIEDTIASAEEVVAVEAGEEPRRAEAQEVTNYVFALEHGLASPLPLCGRLFKEMHRTLLGGRVRGHRDMPGEFRTTQNYIGDERRGFSRARFVPPPAGDELTRGLSDFETFANRETFGVPKLVAIAMMHYQFEALHPFCDGNGRIGRLLIALSMKNLSLLHQPLVYVSGHFEPRRHEYNNLLRRVSTHGEWTEWIRFFLDGVASQAADAEDRVKRLRALRQQYRDALVEENAPSRINSLIDALFIHPMTNVSRAAGELGVSRPTARSYLDRLTEMGALELLDRPYRKAWLAPQIIRVIDE